MHWSILLLVFFAATLLGYKIIDKVPSLLHTPLMSGMNAFSGVTLLACLGATAAAVHADGILQTILGMLAIILAMVNIAAGFGVTDRMLKMFHSKKKAEEDK